jgi:hypothetical protein
VISVANLSRPKYGLATAFMTGAVIYILSEPFWFSGGLPALIRGEDNNRGWWPILAFCAVIAIPMIVRSWVRLLRLEGPALFITGQGLSYFGWKQSIALSDIQSVQPSPGNLLRASFSKVVLTLRNGQTRTVPTTFFDQRPEVVAQTIERALPR